jgi:hypothetical protein
MRLNAFNKYNYVSNTNLKQRNKHTFLQVLQNACTTNLSVYWISLLCTENGRERGRRIAEEGTPAEKRKREQVARIVDSVFWRLKVLQYDQLKIKKLIILTF